MAPLDALTQTRIRSLEVDVAWLIGRDIDDPEFAIASKEPDYILQLAEKIAEEEDD